MSTATRSSYLGRLHHQWQTELADRPAADPDGTPWASLHPCLAGPSTLEDILATISASEREHTDAVLHALLSLARDGREKAARTVLQTMLPTVRRQGFTARYRSLEDPLSCAGAAMWTAITTYPLHRTRSVAANLALEALHQLDADAALTPTPVGDLVTLHLEADQLAGHSPEPGPTDREIVAATLAWALDHDALSRDEVRLLALTHLAHPTPTSAQIGAELDMTASAVRKRHSRAVHKLAAALTARLGTPCPDDLVELQRHRR